MNTNEVKVTAEGLIYQVRTEGNERIAEVFFDGSASPNPGERKYACSVNGVTYAEKSGVGTNNQAEYMGMIIGLHKAVLLQPKPTRIEVKGDSQLVIKQMRGEYAVKAPELLTLLLLARLIISKSQIPVSFTWVPRSQNSICDRLSKNPLPGTFFEEVKRHWSV